MRIEIDGATGLGKTTQAELLGLNNGGRQVQVLPALEHFEPELRKLSAPGAKSETPDELRRLAPILMRALVARREHADRNAADVVVEDGGTSLHVARLVALLRHAGAAPTNPLVTELRTFVDRMLGSTHTRRPVVSILLRHSDSAMLDAEFSARRQGLANGAGLEFEMLFSEELNRRARAGSHAIVSAVGPYVRVQDEVRAVLSACDARPWPPTCRSLDVLLGLGGLSESGKSTVSRHLHETHGFARLKIGYFTALAQRGGKQLLDMRPRERALALWAEIAAFADAHYFARRYVLESLYDLDSTLELKKCLGEQFAVWVTTCSRDEAARRVLGSEVETLAEARERLAMKDAKKSALGGEKIQACADEVFDNEGTLAELLAAVDRCAGGLAPEIFDAVLEDDDRRRTLPANFREAIADATRRVVEAAPKVNAVVVVGGGRTNEIVEGLSDIDLLAVTTGTDLDMAQLRREHRVVQGIKVGYNNVRTELLEGLNDASRTRRARDERPRFTAGCVPSKVVYFLYKLHAGRAWLSHGSRVRLPFVGADLLASVMTPAYLTAELEGLAEELRSARTHAALTSAAKHAYAALLRLLLRRKVDVQGYATRQYVAARMVWRSPAPELPGMTDVLECGRYDPGAAATLLAWVDWARTEIA